MTHPKNNRRGFTAVELVVVILVIAIFVTVTLVWVDRRRDEMLREQVRSSLRITSFRISDYDSGIFLNNRPHVYWREPGGREEIALRMPVWSLREPLPVELAFDVEFHLEETGEIVRGHPLAFWADRHPEGAFYPHDAHAFAAGREGEVLLRIVLTPSRDVAMSHLSGTKYYDGPAITSDVVSATVTRYREGEANPAVVRAREMYTELTGIDKPPASQEERNEFLAGGFDEKLFDAIEGMTALNPYQRGDATRVDHDMQGVDVTPAFPFLIELLGDSGSAMALYIIGEPAIVPLVDALKHENSQVRLRAIGSLENLAFRNNELRDTMAQVVVEPLIDLLDDEDPKIRDAAVTALGLYHEDRTVEAVMRTLDDEDPSARASAAGALGQLSDPEAVEPLIEALQDESVRVRGAAARSLGRLGDFRATEPLIQVLREDPGARASAATALGQLSDLEAVEPLIEALQYDDVDVRLSAAWSLGLLGDLRATAPLIQALRDDDAYVGSWVAAALGELEAEEAVEALVDSLDSEDEDLRKAAASALEKITGLNHGENPEKWLQWLQSRTEDQASDEN